jgi:CRISPR-associated protein Cmr2
MELFNRSVDSKSTEDIGGLIRKQYESKLFDEAFEKGNFKIPTLAEIASIQLSSVNETKWKAARSYEKDIDYVNKNILEEYRVVEEGAFYQALKKSFEKELKSFHKYICVVQADGDNVGKTVSHQGLSYEKVKEISEALLQFGKNAKTAIDVFGGLPIYAGGDDLLFIAPVVGKDSTTILDLLDKLNDISFSCVKNVIDSLNLKDKDNKEIKASLSFGVSVSYYKYPLYEALESARNLLFGKAKKVDGKNAVALDLRKHSGGSFYMELSKNEGNLRDKFNAMIAASSAEESVVSAVSHKIRGNEGLLKLWIEDSEADKIARNENFFKKYMKYSPSNPDTYKKATLELMNELCLIETDAAALKAMAEKRSGGRTKRYILFPDNKEERKIISIAMIIVETIVDAIGEVS